MKQITGNEPAMPTENWQFIEGKNYKILSGGITIRQHFAAMAMQGLLANPVCLDIAEKAGILGKSDEFYASIAVEHADALIAELNK